MTKCTRCQRELPEAAYSLDCTKRTGHKSHCKDCRKEYRKSRPDIYRAGLVKLKVADRAHPEKNRCRKRVAKAISDGQLIRLPCEQCGDPNVQAHHDDYSKPLEVRWLCPMCHGRHHYRARNGVAEVAQAAPADARVEYDPEYLHEAAEA